MEQKDSIAPDLPDFIFHLTESGLDGGVLEERSWPPGHWSMAGRFEGAFGVFVCTGNAVSDFIPATHLPKLIAVYKRQGKASLAAKLEELRGNVEALRLGRGKLLLDLRAAPAAAEGEKTDAA